ncbi:helix-turn-helix domain-containing protein [Elusimicrobiota bacterium]
MKDEFERHLEKSLRDREFRIHFEAARSRREIARKVALMRKTGGLTQSQLASKIGTRQSNIARLESATDTRMPSLELLGRVAKALGHRMIILFE